MIEAYLESKRKDLPGYPGGVPRWVLHTDKLMMRYINEGKAVYIARQIHYSGLVGFSTWTKQDRFRTLPGRYRL